MSMTARDEEKLKILTAFLKLYPSSRLDKEGLTMYLLMLYDVSAGELIVAMQEIARHSKFYPSVSEILDTIEALRGVVDPSRRVPSADEAWYEVTRQMQEAFPYKAPRFSTPEIAATVRNMGWRMICMTPTRDMNIVRAHFRDIYQNMLRRAQGEKETRAILASLPANKPIILKLIAGKSMGGALIE